MEVQTRHASLEGPTEWFTGDVWIGAVARGEAAATDRLMTHLSITEGDTAWGEHVSDAEFEGGTA